jgi:hypothetical protein
MVTKGDLPNIQPAHIVTVHVHQISSTPVMQRLGNDLTGTLPAQPPIEQRDPRRPLESFTRAASIRLLPSLLVHHFVELYILVSMESFPS